MPNWICSAMNWRWQRVIDNTELASLKSVNQHVQASGEASLLLSLPNPIKALEQGLPVSQMDMSSPSLEVVQALLLIADGEATWCFTTHGSTVGTCLLMKSWLAQFKHRCTTHDLQRKNYASNITVCSLKLLPTCCEAEWNSYSPLGQLSSQLSYTG